MFWRVLILTVLALANVTLFCSMVWGPTGLVEYYDLKQRHSDLEKEMSGLDAENLSLSREIRLLQSDGQYVEKMIRQRLRYVRDNEILYLFGDAENAGSGAAKNDGKN